MCYGQALRRMEASLLTLLQIIEVCEILRASGGALVANQFSSHIFSEIHNPHLIIQGPGRR